jgi:hypothetical protein
MNYLSNGEVWIRSIIGGIIALIIGLAATYFVDMVLVTSDDLQWALIAVGFASFFAGFAGFMSGVIRSDEITPYSS